MVIIRICISMKSEDSRKIVDDIHEQAKTGVIVLPQCCELLSDVQGESEIKAIDFQKREVDDFMGKIEILPH